LKAKLDLSIEVPPKKYGIRTKVLGDGTAVLANPMWLPAGQTYLPHFSLYDLLGWCISHAVQINDAVPKVPAASATTSPTQNTASTLELSYYLPLLTLFSSWTVVVSNRRFLHTDQIPSMTSITWFPPAAKSTTIHPVILGSTLTTSPQGAGPGISGLRKANLAARKQNLNRPIKGKPKDNSGPDLTVAPAIQEYGHCAETNQLILYCSLYLYPSF
jgi:hypothetical protein